MTLEEYEHKLFLSKQRAESIASALAICEEQEREALLREYIGCKYFLTSDEMITDDLLKLGDISTEKLAELRRGGLELHDKSVGCTSVASSVTKKALLVLSLGKAIGVKFDPDQAAEAATVPLLAALAAKELEKKRNA